MKVRDLVQLFEKLDPDSEIKIAGWKESKQTARYAWDSEPMQEKHFMFSYDIHGKVIVHVEYDV
jgi:hypothetical protein